MTAVHIIIVPAGGRAVYPVSPCTTERDVTAWMVSEGLDELIEIEPQWPDVEDEPTCRRS